MHGPKISDDKHKSLIALKLIFMDYLFRPELDKRGNESLDDDPDSIFT